MKAAQINDYGDTSVITVNEAAKPEPGEGQVLVEVHGSSVNPFDDKVMQGYMKSAKALEMPATLGGDIAGVVAEVGPGVTGFEPGQKVYGQAGLFGGGSGALAEYAVTGAGQLGLMPEGLSFEEAGALPLAALSAVQVLVDKMKLRAGQKILIHGGAGGIGSLAVQLAKHLGAYVTATAAGGDVDFVRGLGADEVVDYQAEKFEDVVHGYDAVFDTVAGETYRRSFAVLKPGGMIVSMLEQPDEALAKEHGVTALMQGTKTTTESLGMVREFVNKGAIKPQVAKVFPLDQTRQAFEAYEAGGIRGKVAVKVQ